MPRYACISRERKEVPRGFRFYNFEKLEQKECHADLFVTNVTHFV